VERLKRNHYSGGKPSILLFGHWTNICSLGEAPQVVILRPREGSVPSSIAQGLARFFGREAYGVPRRRDLFFLPLPYPSLFTFSHVSSCVGRVRPSAAVTRQSEKTCDEGGETYGPSVIPAGGWRVSIRKRPRWIPDYTCRE
jgi:hypothetical protein